MADAGYKIRNKEGIYFVTFAVIEWIDVFTRREYADIIIESLNYCRENKGLRIHAWCLMSNHMHLIISAKQGYDLSDILRDFKKYTSRRIIHLIETNKHESRRNWMLWIFKSAGKRNKKNTTYQFWRQNNQPKEMVTNAFSDEKLDYIHNNPVESGIVSRPEDYQYSSARDYCGEKGLIEIDFME